MIEISNFLGDIYKKNSTPTNLRYFALCRYFAKISKIVLITLHICYTNGIMLVMLLAIYTFISTGLYVPPIMICITCFKEQSAYDIGLEIGFNILVGFLAIYVVATFDSLIAIIIVNMLMTSSIIIQQVNDLKRSCLIRKVR